MAHRLGEVVCLDRSAGRRLDLVVDASKEAQLVVCLLIVGSVDTTFGGEGLEELPSLKLAVHPDCDLSWPELEKTEARNADVAHPPRDLLGHRPGLVLVHGDAGVDGQR